MLILKNICSQGFLDNFPYTGLNCRGWIIMFI